MRLITNKYIQSVALFVLIVGGYILYQNLTYEVPPVPVSQAPTGTEIQNMDSGNGVTTQTNSENTTNKTPSTVDYSGTHIMMDGAVMTKDGTVLTDAAINADGTITLSDGTIIMPAFDMRPVIESQGTNTEDAETVLPAVNELSVDLVGTNFAYDVKTIRVKQGDRITINLKSTEGFHDFVVDEFKAATERINEGDSTSVTFVADKKGTFQYYCSVGSHRAKGMVGYLIVE